MTARVGFDMDGVLADFANAYRKVEEALFGRPSAIEPVRCEWRRRPRIKRAAAATSPKPEPERRRLGRDQGDAGLLDHPRSDRGRRRMPSARADARPPVGSLFHHAAAANRGDTVQRQTQRWLREQGFEMPSVLPVSAGRAAAMAPLSLHYYVDDDATNCVDLKSASSTRPILIVDDDNAVMTTSARRLGISTAAGIGAALDFLETSRIVPVRRPLFQQFAEAVRWK